MIRYNLRCTSCDHAFDEWFSNMADWEDRKAVFACPSCGAATIEKALMAPSVGATKSAAEPACGPTSCGTPSCPMASMM